MEYRLSKQQIGMFVRAVMPELYRMQEMQRLIDEIDRGKPPEQIHQRGHREDSPRIARYKAMAAAEESADDQSSKSTGGSLGKAVQYGR